MEGIRRPRHWLVNTLSSISAIFRIKDVRRFNFRMNADTPELREAVQKVIEKLKEEFPDYTFTAEFGKGGS
ncbi:hypothetical protein P4H42_05790 [Paenibacillus macerans]|uniref:hypothetical protein n=1 Tax=Paenibacillus macerans TaxID=44252 RepID=UPI002DB701AC|nr:hypothetical protein [Paenibacillus macerans]MEC0329134.1 hypothetical protein [Paenibacillus macerans]MED4954232.1 hypothetical protein [Paenibacillus macerans]